MKTIRRMMQLALALTLAVLLSGVVNVGSAAAAVVKDERADVTVVVVPKTTSAAAAEGFLTYEIIAINRGSDWARNTTITVPFAPATLKLLNVKFSGAQAWVKEIRDGAFVIEIARLDNEGGTSTATVYFARQPGAARNQGLSQRVAYRWDDALLGGKGLSNIPSVLAQTTYPLAVNTFTVANDTKRLMFSSDIFAPYEPVTFWCDHPSGETEAMRVNGSMLTLIYGEDEFGTYARVGDDGLLNIAFDPVELHPGSHHLVVRGNWTGFTAVAEILK
jgi:hypothetical protein